MKMDLMNEMLEIDFLIKRKTDLAMKLIEGSKYCILGFDFEDLLQLRKMADSGEIELKTRSDS